MSTPPAVIPRAPTVVPIILSTLGMVSPNPCLIYFLEMVLTELAVNDVE